MERAVKEENISALKLDLAKAQSLVLADFRGVTVKNDTALRREFRLNGCKYKVVKNTLLGRAVEGTAMAGIENLFNVKPPAIGATTGVTAAEVAGRCSTEAKTMGCVYPGIASLPRSSFAASAGQFSGTKGFYDVLGRSFFVGVKATF